MNKPKKREILIAEYIIDKLKKFNPFIWHKSKYNSVYIKFRDVRLGSIRISDHNRRSKYKYTYEINSNLTTNEILIYINSMINKIINKVFNLDCYEPEQWKVYSGKEKKYITVKDYKEYKKHILKKDK